MPLSKEKAQGVVTEYKIQWRRKGQASSRVEQLRGDVTDYTITGKSLLQVPHFSGDIRHLMKIFCYDDDSVQR